jgi:hypothetical protein
VDIPDDIKALFMDDQIRAGDFASAITPAINRVAKEARVPPRVALMGLTMTLAFAIRENAVDKESRSEVAEAAAKALVELVCRPMAYDGSDGSQPKKEAV